MKFPWSSGLTILENQWKVLIFFMVCAPFDLLHGLCSGPHLGLRLHRSSTVEDLELASVLGRLFLSSGEQAPYWSSGWIFKSFTTVFYGSFVWVGSGNHSTLITIRVFRPEILEGDICTFILCPMGSIKLQGSTLISML